MLVSDVMVKEICFLNKEAGLIEAAELMKFHRIGSIIVAEQEGRRLVPVGMLTDRDIVIEVVADDVEMKKLTVEDVMTRDVVTIQKGVSIFFAIQTMEREGIRRLPVVDEKGSLCGIVSADDISGYLAVAIHSLSKIVSKQRNLEQQLKQLHF